MSPSSNQNRAPGSTCPVEMVDPDVVLQTYLGQDLSLDQLDRATELRRYYDARSLTGPAFGNVSPFAIHAEQLDKRCSNWTIDAYTSLLRDSYDAQAATQRTVRLALDAGVSALYSTARQDTEFARSYRGAAVTPLAYRKYRSLYEAIVTTGEGLSDVVTGGRFTTEQASSLAPALVPGTALRKRGITGYMGMRRGMNNRELSDFETRTSTSLVDVCDDVDQLVSEVGNQIDRIVITRALLDYSRIMQTKLGRSIGLVEFTANAADRLARLSDVSEGYDQSTVDDQKNLYENIMEHYRRSIKSISKKQKVDDPDVLAQLRIGLEKMEQWQADRNSGQERIHVAREKRISKGIGVIATGRLVDIAGDASEVTDEGASQDGGTHNISEPIVQEAQGLPSEGPVAEAVPEESSEDGADEPLPVEGIADEIGIPDEETQQPVDEAGALTSVLRDEADFWYEEQTPPEIEAEVVQLGWEVMPPEITMDDIRNYILEDPRLNAPGTVIDWRRIEDLLYLKNIRQGTLYRSKAGDLGCDLVYFVAVFETDITRVAVADNPIYGNATYVLAEHRMPGTWDEVLKLPRRVIREMGGIQKYHVDQNNHLAKIIKTLNEELALPPLGG